VQAPITLFIFIHIFIYIPSYKYVKKKEKKITPGQLWVIERAGVTRGGWGEANKID